MSKHKPYSSELEGWSDFQVKITDPDALRDYEQRAERMSTMYAAMNERDGEKQQFQLQDYHKEILYRLHAG